MSRSPDDYDVGYCKPPVATRFPAGQSGNPKGRPKGALNLATVLNRALREKVIIIEHGRRKAVTKLDAAVKGLVNRAVKGDTKAMQQMLGLAPLVGLEAAAGAPALDANDAAVLAGLMKRMGVKGESNAKPKGVARKRSGKSKPSSYTSGATP